MKKTDADGQWFVSWDNGGDACGTFPWAFDSEEEAQQHADEWVAEVAIEWGLSDDDEQPYAEAIFLPGGSDPEAADREETFSPIDSGWIGKDGKP